MKILKYSCVFLVCLFSYSCNSKNEKTKPLDYTGCSIERAIKVNSVKEEYLLAKKRCPDCQLESQDLLLEKGKHYDRLNYVKPSGEKVAYYFDITSFY